MAVDEEPVAEEEQVAEARVGQQAHTGSGEPLRPAGGGTQVPGLGGQPPQENPDLHGAPTQLPPDEPHVHTPKPSIDRGDPHADGNNEPSGS